MIDHNFWRDKRVLISGHTGFKGSWLSLLLKILGANITGLSSLNHNDNAVFFNMISDKLNIESFDIDINNYNDLESAIGKREFDIFFHMAAQPLVRHSYASPLETFNTNAIGTLNFLELLRNYENIKSSVIITTDKCYENKEIDIGYKETDRMGGHDPYSASKACAELIIGSYQRSFFYPKNIDLGLCSVRAGNVIGGGDFSEDRLIPDILRSVKNNSVLSIRSPNSTRPWQHVLEPLVGYLEIAKLSYSEGSSFNSAWNFGPYESDVKTVKEVVDKCITYLEKPIKADFKDSDDSKHEAGLLKLNIEKALSELSWKPSLDFDSAIKLTMDWYSRYLNHEDMFLCSNKQIQDFIDL